MVDHRDGGSWLGRESWGQNQGMEPGLVLTVPYASPWSSGAAYSRLSSLLGTFVNHAKSSNLTNSEILEQAKDQKDNERSQCFLEIFEGVREEYEALLRKEDAVDFHDLIKRAAETIGEDRWENPFRYVLIDELQDISNGRMNLTKALKKPDLAYFLVGDDWQSIYRFAGSYVGLIHQVDKHLASPGGRVLQRPSGSETEYSDHRTGSYNRTPNRPRGNWKPTILRADKASSLSLLTSRKPGSTKP